MNNGLSTLRYYAYVKIDNKLWVSNSAFNGLYTIDVNDYTVEYHGRFRSSSFGATDIHASAGRYNDILFFVPQTGDGVDFYNLNTGEFDSCQTSLWNDGLPGNTAAGYWRNGDDLFLIPKYSKHPLLKYSFDKKEINIVAEKSFKAINESLVSNQQVLTIGSAFFQDKIWFTIWGSNRIVSIDPYSDEWKDYIVNYPKRLQTIFYTKDAFWIGAEDTLLKWDIADGIIGEYPGAFAEQKESTNVITEVVADQEYVYALPQKLGSILKIDVVNNCVSKKIDITADDYNKVLSWRDLKGGYILNDRLVLNPVGRDKEVIIDTNSEKMELRKHLVPDETIYARWKKVYLEGEISLTNFIYNFVEY